MDRNFLSSIHLIDELLKEYFVYRGFTETLKKFEIDLKNDKSHSMRFHRMVQEIMSEINNLNLPGVTQIWNQYVRVLFHQIDKKSQTIIIHLENSLYKLYLVKAHQASKIDKITEFLQKFSPIMINDDSWKEWLALPYIKSPEINNTFALYYTKLWQDTFIISLHNALNSLWMTCGPPRLVKLLYSSVNSNSEDKKLSKNNVTIDPNENRNESSNNPIQINIDSSMQDNMKAPEQISIKTHVDDHSIELSTSTSTDNLLNQWKTIIKLPNSIMAIKSSSSNKISIIDQSNSLSVYDNSNSTFNSKKMNQQLSSMDWMNNNSEVLVSGDKKGFLNIFNDFDNFNFETIDLSDNQKFGIENICCSKMHNKCIIHLNLSNSHSNLSQNSHLLQYDFISKHHEKIYDFNDLPLISQKDSIKHLISHDNFLGIASSFGFIGLLDLRTNSIVHQYNYTNTNSEIINMAIVSESKILILNSLHKVILYDMRCTKELIDFDDWPHNPPYKNKSYSDFKVSSDMVDDDNLGQIVVGNGQKLLFSMLKNDILEADEHIIPNYGSQSVELTINAIEFNKNQSSQKSVLVGDSAGNLFSFTN